MATIPRQGFLYEILWDGNERKWKMDRGLMTHDRPTHGHKRKRLLRASDENHFPIEIQIFMLSIRSSWNYYRPIASLSRDENVSKMNSFGPTSNPRSWKKTWYFIVYIFARQLVLRYYCHCKLFI